MKAMIFAAGLGTRLKPFTNHMPKALVEVGGKTLLERNIRYLQRYGIDDIVINVHHFAPKVEELLVRHKGFGSSISISDERSELLETGGGLKKATPFFEGEQALVVMNADVLTDLDLGKMITAHLNGNAVATLAVMKRGSSRQLLFDNEMQLCGWMNNITGEQRIARQTEPVHPYAFSGIQVLSGGVLKDISFEGKFSLIDLYLHLAKAQLLMGYDHTGSRFIDVGKPESIEQAENMFE